MQCKKELAESYGIMSLSTPAREKMILCPSVKLTCCPVYEQFKIFKTYHTKVKPYFKIFEQVMKKELELLKEWVCLYFLFLLNKFKNNYYNYFGKIKSICIIKTNQKKY